MKRLLKGKLCIDMQSINQLLICFFFFCFDVFISNSVYSNDYFNTEKTDLPAKVFETKSLFALNTWEYASSNGQPSARHECAYVELGGKFYLIGGRGNPALNIYNPQTNTWSTGNNIPNGKELHHFQAVTYNNKIYIIGAFTGGFPTEQPVADIYIYDPVSNSWTVLANQIPANRRRGAAGAVVYNNKIYIVGGVTNGHTDGWVNWVDEFDPASLAWKTLPDAPHQRDHLQAAVLNDKIYIAGGRRSAYPNTINLTEASVDVFNFATQQWSTLPSSANIPTPRAGTATVVLNNELVVIAGESGNNGYHRQVEAFNPQTNTWRSLAQTNEGRNGPGGISYNGKLYIVAGMVNGSEVSSQEIFTSSATSTSPQLVTPIADVNSIVNASPVNITLTNYFNDDGGTGNLAFSITSNTNTGLIQAAITNNTGLQISYTNNATGTGKIKIKATDQQGNFIEDEFSVTVTNNTVPSGSNMYINSGGNAVQFGNQLWSADKNYSGGSAYSNSGEIDGTENDNIYLVERYGQNFGYAIPVASGTYTVNLHFAEIFWSAAGKRVFNVNIENGKAGTNSLDIFAAAGKNKALIKSYTVQVTDGTLDINFTSVTDNAKISGIEIISATNACGDVSGLTASNIKSTTASLSWAAVSGASKYQAEFRKSGTEAWTVISTGLTTTTYSLTGLTAGTAYEWRVKAFCSAGYGGYTQSAFTTIIPVANAGNDISLTMPASSANLTGKGTVASGTIVSFAWAQASGPSTATFSNTSTANATLSNLVAGTYVINLIVKDDAGNTSKLDQVSIIVNSSSTPTQPAVTSFTLVDATTNKDILVINEGTVISSSSLPAGGINIRANINPVATSKVVFALSGSQSSTRSESTAPYALFGDNNGDYDSWKFVNGSYTLTGTPYSSNGTAAPLMTIHFSVSNSARSINGENIAYVSQNLSNNPFALQAESKRIKLNIYPNPASNVFNLIITTDINQPINVSVTDVNGRMIESQTYRDGRISIGNNYKKGIYFVKVTQGSQTVHSRILKN